MYTKIRHLKRAYCFMKKRFITIALLLLFVVISTSSTHAQTSPKIVALGDSITEGYVCSLKSALNLPAANFLGVTPNKNGPVFPPLGGCGVNYAGYRGFTTVAIIGKLASDAELKTALGQADTVVIHLGTNDMYQEGHSEDVIKGNLEQIISTIKGLNPNIRVVLAKIIPSRDNDMSVLNGKIAEIGGVDPVDAGKYFDRSIDLSSDGVHPTGEGYRKVAQAIAEAFGASGGGGGGSGGGGGINIPGLAFGFNIHSLAKESESFIRDTFASLKNSCSSQVTYVRLWGFNKTFGIDGLNSLQKVINAASGTGIKLIVAIEDFPSGPAEANPGAWFGGGYKNEYEAYAKALVGKYGRSSEIAVWELMNEPHCKGNATCLPQLINFVNYMSSQLAPLTSAFISPGIMTSQIDFEVYKNIANLPAVTANTCHFYNEDSVSKSSCLSAMQAAPGKFFYIGEAGYKASGPASDGSCTASSCTNACTGGDALQNRAAQIKSDMQSFTGANAFLLWQYSPEGNSNLICDRFSVFPQDPICSGVGLGGGDVAACLPTGGGSSTAGTPNIFSSLLSFFGGFVSALPGNFNAQKTTVVEDLATLPETDDLFRYKGKINKWDRQVSVGTVSYPAQVSRQVSLAEIISNFFLGGTTNGASVYSDNAVTNYSVSTTTPGGKKVLADTLVGYLGGKVADPEEAYKIAQAAERGDFSQSGDYAVNSAAINSAGPLDKLRPFTGLSPTGEWKKSSDSEKDEIMDGVINNYACNYEKRNCEKEIYHDYLVAWVVPADGYGMTGDISQIPTWFTPVQQKDSRPFLVSEFFCSNPNFQTQNNRRDMIDRICAYIYGDSLVRGGVIYIKSVIGQLYGQKYGAAAKLRTPSDLAKYGGANNIWNLMPKAPVEDIKGTTRIRVHRSGSDPTEKEGNFTVSDETAVAIPGIKSVSYLGKKVQAIFKPYGLAEKPYPVTQTQCGNGNAVAGNVPDKIGGGALANFVYKIGELFKGNNVLGVTDDQGQVLADSTAPNPPPPAPSPVATRTVNRGAAVEVDVPIEAQQAVDAISGPQSFTAAFMPYEIAQQLSTQVGGVAPEAMSMQANVNCANNLTCETAAPIPLLGGPVLLADPKAGLFTQLIAGFGSNSNQSNTGGWLREYTKSNQPNLAQTQVDPWSNLASFNRVKLPLSNTGQAMLVSK